MAIMCQGRLDRAAIEKAYGIDTATHFAAEFERLADFEAFKEGQGYRVLTVTESDRYDDLGGAVTGPGWGGASSAALGRSALA